MTNLQRIVAARLADLDLGPVEAATAAGIERTYIKDIVAGRKKSVRQDKMPGLAKALRWRVEDLNAALAGNVAEASESELVAASSDLVPIRTIGTVEAGAFRPVDEWAEEETTTLWEPRDRLFPQARQLAWNVSGDSMNDLKPRPILPGDRVIGVAFDDLRDRVLLRDGMVVVVERSASGGHLREWSVKQLELYEDRYEFHPRSTNPRHRPIIVDKDLHADDGRAVVVLGIVRRVTNDVPL